MWFSRDPDTEMSKYKSSGRMCCSEKQQEITVILGRVTGSSRDGMGSERKWGRVWH